MLKYSKIFILVSLFALACTQKAEKETTKETAKESATLVKNHQSKYWPKVAAYEIFIQSFADSNGDGIGDFNGASAKLDYLQDLGVEAVWLMPIMESPSYHKYDVTNYKSLHPDYGTLEEFKIFVDEAHKRGISIIIDLIINHTSNAHPWFIESQKGEDNPYRDYYVWEALDNIKDDLSKRETSLDSDNITQWHQSDGNDELYYGFFFGGMPDLNFDNPKVIEEIFDIGRFWLDEVGIDGFRMDAAKHIFRDHRAEDNHKFWRDFRAGMEAINPDVYIVGEVWSDAKTVAPYLEGLPALFNFELGYAITDMLKAEQDTQGFMDKYTKIINYYASINSDYTDAIFLANHDQNRIASRLQNAQKNKLAATILLTLPGQPYLYYGEEIGMLGMKPDENIREPFLWSSKESDKDRTTWMKPQYSTDATISDLSVQQQDANSLQSLYKKFINYRKNSAVLSLGEVIKTANTDSDVLSYYRVNEGDSLLVIHNLSSKVKSIAVEDFSSIELNTMNATIENRKAQLPAYASMVLGK